MANTRFGFFSKPPAPQLPPHLDDEFTSMDIGRALFPGGPPSERDFFSPAALKNLQMNAEGALSTMQTAYRRRTLSYHELATAREAGCEELEEAEIRVQSLKRQLEEMAEQLAAKERSAEQLMAELAREKALRETREQAAKDESDRERRRTWRRSNLSCDSDDDKSGRDSIFSSRSRSSSPASTAVSEHGSMSPRISQSKRTLHRITETECANCQGHDVHVAWDTVALLKAENQGLKARVGELEGAVDGALDLVLGIGTVI